MARTGRTMIITQTPLRIGLLGGGTDLPDYYREHGGRVLNCAIDKYIYVIVKQRFDDDIYVNYSKKEIVSHVDDLEHELVREAMRMTGVTKGVEITTLADIPSAAAPVSGRRPRSPSACCTRCSPTRDIRCRRRNWPSGPARSRSSGAGSRSASRISTSPRSAGSATSASGRAMRWWPRSWGCPPPSGGPCSIRSCCSTPASPGARTRSWPSRTRTSPPTRPQLDLLRDLAGFAVDRLRNGDVDAIGAAVRESWETKRKLASGVSNGQIDGAVARALDAGASGVKLTGAGGGGFLLVICPMEQQRAVRRSLADMRELPVKLDRLGSRVVLNVLRDIWG